MKGWECPKCGKCWAPMIMHCDCHPSWGRNDRDIITSLPDKTPVDPSPTVKVDDIDWSDLVDIDEG